MARMVGHTDLTMLCKVHYHADLARICEKMASFRILKGGNRKKETRPTASHGKCAASPESD